MKANASPPFGPPITTRVQLEPTNLAANSKLQELYIAIYQLELAKERLDFGPFRLRQFCRPIIERLDKLEKLIFPPQVYLSIGTVVHRKFCSICNDDYAKCDHIAGRPYWGEFCHTILKDVVPDHVGIVEQPANKLCRVTHFDDAGGRRNRMSWKLEPKPGDKDDPVGGLTTTGIIATVLPGRDGVRGLG